MRKDDLSIFFQFPAMEWSASATRYGLYIFYILHIMEKRASYVQWSQQMQYLAQFWSQYTRYLILYDLL